MKSSSEKSKQIKDVLLLFQPISISFLQPELKIYKIYLQKNVQVIGQVKQKIAIKPYQNNYAFKSEENNIPFRAANIKNSLYQIAIYQVCANDEEILFDQSDFNLAKFFIDYQKDYNFIHDEIQKICSKKQVDSILNHWNGLSLNFTRKNFNHGIKFVKTGAVLEFIVKTQNDYDDLAKKDKIMKQKKQEEIKMKKYKSLRAATLPDALLIKNKQSTKETFSTPNINFANFDPKAAYDHYHKQQPISKEQLKAIKIKIPVQLNKKAKYEQQSLTQQTSEISDMPQNSKYYNFNQTEDKFNQLNQIYETDEQQQVDPKDIKFYQNMEKQIQTALHKNTNIQKRYNQDQVNEMYYQRNKEGASPEIYLQNYQNMKNSLKQSNQSIKVENLSVQSLTNSVIQIQQKTPLKIKEICITFIILCLYLVMIIWLMYPINKIR